MSVAIPKSRAFLEAALATKQASAIALQVHSQGKIQELYLGHTAHEDTGALRTPLTVNSIFDLASLTKILSTTSLLFIAESEERIRFTDKVQQYFPEFPDADSDLLQLLHHNSGLPAHLEFFKRYQNGEAKMGDARAVLPWICELKLSEKKQVYSDLGFILLGFLLEDVYGQSLPALFQEKIARKLKLQRTGFIGFASPSLQAEKEHFVATETCPWRGRTLQGEVHDDNASTMGGAAGHAGLFSSLQETHLCFQHLWRQTQANPAFMNAIPTGQFHYGLMNYPGLRPFPGSAFAGALGHTGFVGTSAWFHPSSGTSVTLLANRVHPSRSDGRWIDTRLQFHKILWEELGLA